MSLSKMAPSGWRYYAEEVASGREDYFALSSDRPGRFLGRGAESLGVTGLEVSALALERLFGHGQDPRDGSALGRSFSPKDDRAVAGFALTFSPMKTVSVLWALGDDAVSEEVVAAHEAAVAAAMDFLEEHAAFTRRQRGGIYQVDTEGFVGVSFLHRTSRAADPQLHTHVLVANKVRADDGKWLSIDARELYETQTAAGMLYKAAIRSELTARLGVSWSAVDERGIAEIEGVPEALCEAWSTRRQQVKEYGAELIATREADLGRSLSSGERAECFQIAAYRTRAAKTDADTPTTELKERWLQEARDWGHDPGRWLEDVLDKHQRSVELTEKEVVARAVAMLENRSATWGRSDVVEVVSMLVSAPDADGVRTRIEHLADAVLRSAGVVSLAAPLPAEPPSTLRRRDQMAVFERHGAVRFTTETMLKREASVLEAVAGGMTAGVAVVPKEIIDEVLSRCSLGWDQLRAVDALLTGGERFALLVGPAGSGKSRALQAARVAWEEAGHPVLGLAPSAMAAAVLREEAGIVSETIASFLGEVDKGKSGLGPGSVVVLDEAGMARTDDLARVVAAVTQAGAKLVLVGDPHQLGAVGPGGLFRTLVEDHGAQELETVRRFNHAWEAATSLRLRARDPSILPVYLRHDRISDGSREQMKDAAFAAFMKAREEHATILLMAADNETAAELSRRCRAELVRLGEVEADGARTTNGTAGVGDDVVTLQNCRELEMSPGDFVRNGERFRVVEVTDSGGLGVVPMNGHGYVQLPPEYVNEHVALGYCLTVHKAQGQTVDRAIVLVEEKMTAEQLYVAMSRGREENRALAITTDDGREEHWRRPSVEAIELLHNVMCHDGAERSAHDIARSSLATYEDRDFIDGLRREARRAIDEQAGPDRRREISALRGRDDIEGAERALREAELRLQLLHRQRIAAEQCEERATRVPLRSHLPGILGEGPRTRADLEMDRATSLADSARRREEMAVRGIEAARHNVEEAQLARSELTFLQNAQSRRETWLADHPEEVRWERDVSNRATHRVEDEIVRRVRHRDPHVDTTKGSERQPERFPRSLEESEAAAVEAVDHSPDPNDDRWEAEVIARATSSGYIHHHPEGPAHHHYEGPTLGR